MLDISTYLCYSLGRPQWKQCLLGQTFQPSQLLHFQMAEDIKESFMNRDHQYNITQIRLSSVF
jgi:hypothetical protein